MPVVSNQFVEKNGVSTRDLRSPIGEFELPARKQTRPESREAPGGFRRVHCNLPHSANRGARGEPLDRDSGDCLLQQYLPLGLSAVAEWIIAPEVTIVLLLAILGATSQEHYEID